MMKEIRLDDPVQLHTTDSLRSSKAEFREQVLYNPFNNVPHRRQLCFCDTSMEFYKVFQEKNKTTKSVFFFLLSL